MMSSKDGVTQIIEVGMTVLTLVALPMRLSFILTTFVDLPGTTLGTTDSLCPKELTHCFIAFCVIDQVLNIQVHALLL